MGCSTSLAKLILFVFNIVFFLLGVASLAIGLWLTFSKNTLLNFVNLLEANLSEADNREKIDAIANQNGLIVIAAIVLIVVGAITLVVGFCGCCGAMKESALLLNIYAFLIGLILIVQIVAAVLAAVFQNKMKTSAETGLRKLENKFYVSIIDYLRQNSTAKAGVTYFINWLQVSLECCDISANSSSWLNSNRTWNGKQLKNPFTCCSLINEEAKAEVQNPQYKWANIEDKLKDKSCPFTENSKSLHQQTCPDKLVSFISSYSVLLIIVCVIFALIQLLGITIACCLVNALRNL